jgi:hypothetical protein
LAKRVKVLRNYNISGHGSGRAGDVRYLEPESYDYLMQHDVNRPLIEDIPDDAARGVSGAETPEKGTE